MANGSGFLGPVQAQLDTLSARDRKLLAGLVLFVGLLVVGFLAIAARSELNDKATRVRDQRAALELLTAQQGEYQKAMKTVEAAEARAAGFAGQTLSGFVEKTALQVGVADQLSITRQGTETESGVSQTRYKCELRRVSYENAIDFIYELEVSGFPLSIETTRLNASRVKGELTMSATLEITEYSFEEG